MEELEDKKAFCRLCLEVINGENFKIDEIVKGVLDSLQLKLREDENDTSVLCNACFTRLFAAYNFKSVCTDMEDCIGSYVNSESQTPVDLREIYLKERQNDQLKRILGNERICRLCMCITHEFTSVKEMDFDTFRTYIPEVDFNSTKEPVVCNVCLDSMNTHTSFLKDCSNVKEESKNISDLEFLEGPFDIDTVKMEIKSEESCADTSLPSLKDESLNCTTESRSESITSNMDEFDVRMCYNKTKHTYLVTQHNQFKHNTISQDQMYHCDSCDYKTVYKAYYTRHLLKHKTIRMYKCNLCDYKSTRENCLARHQLIHKKLTYKCNWCDYKTNDMETFIVHRSRHRDITEDQMFKCDWCEYTTGRKVYLERHKLSHKEGLEKRKLKCDQCEFKTVYKYNLTKHQLRHQQQDLQLRNILEKYQLKRRNNISNESDGYFML